MVMIRVDSSIDWSDNSVRPEAIIGFGRRFDNFSFIITKTPCKASTDHEKCQ
jgi:hypothetical protein